MAAADRARAGVSFVLSKILDEDFVKNESQAANLPFVENERTLAVRIRGYRRPGKVVGLTASLSVRIAQLITLAAAFESPRKQQR